MRWFSAVHAGHGRGGAVAVAGSAQDEMTIRLCAIPTLRPIQMKDMDGKPVTWQGPGRRVLLNF
jgi:hypothetical protein